MPRTRGHLAKSWFFRMGRNTNWLKSVDLTNFLCEHMVHGTLNCLATNFLYQNWILDLLILDTNQKHQAVNFSYFDENFYFKKIERFTSKNQKSLLSKTIKRTAITLISSTSILPNVLCPIHTTILKLPREMPIAKKFAPYLNSFEKFVLVP